MKYFSRLICLLMAMMLLSSCAMNQIPIDADGENEEKEKTEITAAADPEAEPVFIPELTFGDVLAKANRRRHELRRPDIAAATEIFRDFTREKIDFYEMVRPGIAKSPLLMEDVLSDAETYFNLLRYVYGGYQHFGGDAVFFPIFDEIRETLAQKEEWQRDDFADVIYSRLSAVISDNHMHFNRQTYEANYGFFAWEIPFDKVGERYMKRESGLFVDEITGYGLNEVFRLAVNEEGAFFYIPVFISEKTDIRELTVTVIYENGEEEVVSVPKYKRYAFAKEKVGLSYENGIPIASIGEMYDIFQPRGARFLSFAEDLVDEDVIIVDIRANGGGCCELTKIWLYLLTGEIVPNNYLSVSYAAEPFEDTYDELFVQALLHHFEGSTLEMHNNKWSDLVLEMIPMIPTLSRSARFGDFHSISDQMDRVVANDKLIILLINRADGSAAEQFTDLIMSMENTLVIGQNTSGTLVTGSMLVLYLPNSNIQVTMPMDFNLFDEAYFLEGIGIAPDVWVVGDSLKAALAILEKRGDS